MVRRLAAHSAGGVRATLTPRRISRAEPKVREDPMSRVPLALLLLAAPLSSLRAQGWIDLERPRIPLRGPATLTRVGSSVRAVVDGRVARFEVEERFRNTGPVIAEGTYIYPLPGEAVFSEFSLFQGEQELKGEMMSADQARSEERRVGKEC